MSDNPAIEINPENIKKADMVVCIPSYNEADSISYPTIQADKGLLKYFSDKSSVIINCDNDSPDDTKGAFLKTATETPKIYVSTPAGVRGKGNNFRNLFRKIVELGPQAVVVVDADLKSITPQWIKHLGEPIWVYLKNEAWDEAVANFGIDVWMTTLAINQRIQICQSFMGRPKIHRTKDPGAHLGPMFRQVVGTIFSMMNHFESYWTQVKYSRPTAIYGFGLGEVEMPPKVEVNSRNLLQKFHGGFEDYQQVWERILTEDVFKKLLEIRSMKEREFNFPTDLWARVLFDTAVGYRYASMDPDVLLDSLIPLYFGRTLSFVKKTKKMSIRQAEEAIEDDCMTFEMTKPYLIQRWMEKKSSDQE